MLCQKCVKRLYYSLFSIKAAGLRPLILLKGKPRHSCFHVSFAKFLKTLFFTEHLRWLLFSTLQPNFFYSEKSVSKYWEKQSFMSNSNEENVPFSFRTLNFHLNLTRFHLNLTRLLITSVCVCVCVCVYVCVCVCVFISFHHRGFSWLNKTINVIPEFSSSMLYRENVFVSRTFVSTSKTFV